MKYPEFASICITILKEQADWLAEQPNSKSEVIRFAIKELIEKENVKSEYITIPVTIAQEMSKWLYEECLRRSLPNKSLIIGEAIELLRLTRGQGLDTTMIVKAMKAMSLEGKFMPLEFSPIFRERMEGLKGGGDGL